MGNWRDRAVTIAAWSAILAAVFSFSFHTWVALGGAHLSFTGGIWLSAAQDLDNGVLYRALTSEIGYGGTRYFPLFFTICAAFLKLGATVLTAGWIGISLSLLALGVGMRRLALTLGADRTGVWLFTAAVIAPYFVQQTAFEIRADILAAGFNVLGLAHGLRLWREPPADSRRAAGLAAFFFTLAFATKVTSLWAPATLILCGMLGRRRPAVLRLGAVLSIGLAVFFLLVIGASRGRALDSWAVVMFAGSSFGSTLGGIASGGFLVGLAYSRVLRVLVIIAILAPIAGILVKGRAEGAVPVWLANALFAAVSFTTAFILSSPGAVPGNQMTEWIVGVWLVLATVAVSIPSLRRVIYLVVSGVVVWMSIQDVTQANRRRLQVTAEVQHARAELVGRVALAPAAILSDSAVWPSLARRPVVVPDPFAFRLLARSRPDIELDLIARIRRREFPFVILEFNPTSAEGLRIYGFAHLTPAVIQAILENYRLESSPLENALVYVPK